MNKWIQRSLLALPLWSDLCRASQDDLKAFDATYKQLHATALLQPNAGLHRLIDPPTRFRRHLHHELSCKFPPVEKAINLSSARKEFAACRTLYAHRRGNLHTRLMLLAKSLAVIERYRTTGVATSPDPNGRFVVFPPAGLVRTQLDALDRILDASAECPRGFRAMVALVGITNCHPFEDGNGRVARAFFNFLASPNEDECAVYLPLREISQYSRGGYLLRVRQAELQHDWAPLARFLLTACRFWLRRLK